MHLVNEGGAFYPLEYVSVCINSMYICTDTSYTGVYLAIQGCTRLFSPWLHLSVDIRSLLPTRVYQPSHYTHIPTLHTSYMHHIFGKQTQGARRIQVLITVPFFESFYAVHILVSEGGRAETKKERQIDKTSCCISRHNTLFLFHPRGREKEMHYI